MPRDTIIEQFQERAEAAAAKVLIAHNLPEAFAYCISVCTEKEACKLLLSGCTEPLSQAAQDLCQLKEPARLIAAPGFDAPSLEPLVTLGQEQNISVIQQGLRQHLAGIDIGLTMAEFGLAETGTLVLDSSQEDIRLATMISEIHVAVLFTSNILLDAYELRERLSARFKSAPNYTAFITGPSRTADIERALTLGVHGPLQLHVVLIDDTSLDQQAAS